MTLRIKGSTVIKGCTTVGLFSPRSLSGLSLWLDASDASTITIATGVSQWNDKSGNGNNATQATGSNQPTVQTAAQNGRNTLRFTGAFSQRMQLSSAISVANGYTLFCVLRRGGPSGSNNIIVLGLSTLASAYAMEFYSDLKIYSALNSYYVLSSPQASTAYNVATVYLYGSATPGGIRFNGANVTDVAAAGGPSNTTFDLIGFGDNGYTNGEIAEIILYNSVLSATNISAIEAYLKAKWATP